MKLKATTTPVSKLLPEERDWMFELMNKYYDHMTRIQFEEDLSKKTAVIVLRDPEHRRIQGFSTLLNIKKKIGSRQILAIFSGDTIIERAYWGQKVLGIEFLKYLWWAQLRNPFHSVYWLLISKGYKTYLLMANNFKEHYPRYEHEMPDDRRAIMDAFYGEMFPKYYRAESHRIEFDRNLGNLREGVAEIDPELIASNPRVAYFQSQNPDWKSGTELACLARMTLWMPFQYQWKAIFRTKSAKPAFGSRTRPTLQVERRKRMVPVALERRSRQVS